MFVFRKSGAAIVGVLVVACGTAKQDDDDSGNAAAGACTITNACTSVCDRGNAMDCGNPPPSSSPSYFDHASCVGMCTRISDMKAATNDCYAEATALVNCLKGLSDVCAGFELDSSTGDVKACNAETTNYQNCAADYCADHTKQDYCN